MTTSPACAGGREWAGLGVLVLPALLASMDLSVLFMASPWLSADLEPTGPQLLWIMDIYGFLMAGLLLTMGSLGDRIGRRRLLLVGATAFGAASVLAAYASTAAALVAARALLGVGGATLAPSCLALIRNMFRDADQRRAAIGVFTAALTGGIAIGPIVGGLLLENFWWGSVFLINVPVMVLLLVVGPLLLPESTDPDPGRFDLLSALLSMAAILPVMYGVKEMAEAGRVEWLPVATVAVGIAVGVTFVRRQATLSDPLFDVGLFRNSGFTAAFGAYGLLIVGSAGMGYLVTQHVQLVLGLRPFAAALWQLPTIGGTLTGIVLATTLVRWVRPAVPAGAGLLLAAAGFAFVSSLGAASGVGVLVLGYSVLTLGTGLLAPLAIDMIVTTAPSERAGSAAAMGETGAELGGAAGIAVLGSIAAAVYRARVADAVPPGLPPEDVEAASGTLGGAIAVADQLPETLGGPLREAATTAFAAGFSTTAAVAAGLMLLTAVGATARLWRVRLDAGTGQPARVH
ncbi:MFS transporter [Pseudonocardia nigra]|uniref:MFS transporter n=1 Tax=Pseudonocardia nigra TaxID=1921578 RepID=UPI001C5F3BF9|nr:MFS transporter [Pseudonocardia nigra]